MKLLLAALLATLCCATLAADAVALQGMLGKRALLIVNGTAPRSVAPGETHLGVKVLSTAGDEAVVEIDGKRHTLRVGDAPASVGGNDAGPRGSRIVLSEGSGGHFTALGAINGRAVNFMVDTGASVVALGAAEAGRLGIDYRRGEAGQARTANGTVATWRIRLASVRIRDVEVHDVEAIVVPGAMGYVLLGNSFLGRFQMKRENDLLMLERRF